MNDLNLAKCDSFYDCLIDFFKDELLLNLLKIAYILLCGSKIKSREVVCQVLQLWDDAVLHESALLIYKSANKTNSIDKLFQTFLANSDTPAHLAMAYAFATTSMPAWQQIF